MKGNSRNKVGKKIGSPAFRTPSFFKNKSRPQINLIRKSVKINDWTSSK